MRSLIGYVALSLMLLGIIGVIKPIAMFGVPTRARAAGVVLAGLMILIIGGMIAELLSPTTSPPNSNDRPPVQQTPQAARVEPGFGNGTYAVPSDVQPGTYRAVGRGTCYWARMRGFGGELNDIIANGNSVPEIVTIQPGDAGFQTQGCGRWVPVNETAPATLATEFGDGTHAVGTHIAPGRYRSNGTGTCYWARLSDFGHELNAIIANGNNPSIVQIAQDDAGFTTFGCGMWSRLQ
jgi:hypothetical protein